MFSKAKPAPSRTSAEAPAPKPSGVPSIVSPELTVNGNLTSSGDIQVDGSVEGDVEASHLTIGENGAVYGKVSARRVRICGRVTGEVHGGEVTLAASARVHGDIVHDSLAIEAGADIEGHCRRRDKADAGDAAAPTLPTRGRAKGSGKSADAESPAGTLANGSAGEDAKQRQPAEESAE